MKTMNSQPVKILLADDHSMVRAGLRLLLTRLFGEVAIVEACDYVQAMELCAAHPDCSLILLDRQMPGMRDGAELRAICECAAGVPVVILSASEDPAHVREAIDGGARGYLPKTTGEAILFTALQLILSGGTYLPLSLLDTGAVRAAGAARVPPAAQSGDQPSLTPRQVDILLSVARGYTNKDIARRFGISTATVQTHINAIFRALGVSNRTRAVHVAGQLGLIPASTS